MKNTIKHLDSHTIAMNRNGKTKILTKHISTLGLTSWYNIKGEIYA
jgi:sRNA-binding regulator protein Hfq